MDIFNEEFNGTFQDEKKYKKLLALQDAAKRLKGQESLIFKCNFSFEDAENTHPNSTVTVNIGSKFILLNTAELRTTLAEMMMLADDVGVVALKDGSGIRFTFGVRDIWREE